MDGSRSNLRTRGRWVRAVRGTAGLAAATVVSAAAAADGPRAVLLPPRVGDPAPAGVVARGAADDNPLATTPVVRRTPTRPLVPPTGAKPAAPDWLSGVDPNVIPAGGHVPAKAPAAVRLTNDTRPAAAAPAPASAKLAAPPPLFGPGEPNPLAKGVESLKGAVSPAAAPTGSPADPVQGTTANGAPVLAGPPAWRWYGYGTVTPGANPYAPSGQYPRGSSNWYSVTKATPGAFPVPVVNPFRGGPGAEPPSYAGTTPQPTRPVVTAPPHHNAATVPQPRPTPAPVPAPVPTTPTGGTKFDPPPAEPTTVLPPPVIPIPTLAPGPLPAPVAVAPPALAPIPLPPPPAIAAVALPKLPEPGGVGTGKDEPEPPAAAKAATAPPVLPPLSVMPVTVAPPAALPTVPVVAPVSAPVVPADNEIRWQSNPEYQPSPAPGTWMKPAERRQTQPGASAAPRQPIARGQACDDVQERADPVEAVVQAVCRGRATGIDVRHTGPRKVTVCFETRSQTDATALVRDLSARPELAPYEINFCVLVK